MRVLYYFVFCFQSLLFERRNRGHPIDGWRMFILLFAIWARLLLSLTELCFQITKWGPRDWVLWAVAGAVGVGVYTLLSRQGDYEKYERGFRSLSKTQRFIANTAVCLFSAFALLSPVLVRKILY